MRVLEEHFQAIAHLHETNDWRKMIEYVLKELNHKKT